MRCTPPLSLLLNSLCPAGSTSDQPQQPDARPRHRQDIQLKELPRKQPNATWSAPAFTKQSLSQLQTSISWTSGIECLCDTVPKERIALDPQLPSSSASWRPHKSTIESIPRDTVAMAVLRPAPQSDTALLCAPSYKDIVLCFILSRSAIPFSTHHAIREACRPPCSFPPSFAAFLPYSALSGQF